MKSDKELKGTTDEYLSKVPYDTRQLMIKDACTMYKSAVSNMVNGNITHFEMKPKSRNNNRGIFWIDSNALKIINKQVSVFSTRLGKVNKYIRVAKCNLHKLPDANKSDCKILYISGAYYLVLSVGIDANIVDYDKKQFLSLDPGIRTFQTCFDPTGNILEFGKVDSNKIKMIYHKIDKLSRCTRNALSRTKQHLRKRIRKLYKHVTGIVSNLHNHCSSFIAKNYDHVLLPSFETSKMVKSDKLHKSVKRMMNSLSFYKFKEKLKYACSKTGSSLYIVDEAYTSKLCGNCGILNNIGSSKVYTCSCGVKLDRDVNGARNILIQYLYH
jgi:putative transposase